jgi:hypothetical protein
MGEGSRSGHARVVLIRDEAPAEGLKKSAMSKAPVTQLAFVQNDAPGDDFA